LEPATVEHLDQHRADLPNPEQAQRQAIERQEGEDLLFDVPMLEEPTDQAVEEDPGRPTPEVPALPLEACMRVFPVICNQSGGSQSQLHFMSTSDRHGDRWIWLL
jgi:hypothetical protein